MAREYSKLPRPIWDDPIFQRLSDDAQRAYLYFLSSPQAVLVGTYILPMPMILHHLRWSEDKTLTAMHELGRRPWILWDRENCVLHQPHWFADNAPLNPKMAQGMASRLLSLPDCELKGMAIDDLRNCGKFKESVVNTIGDWKWSGGERTPDLFAGRLPAAKGTPASAVAPDAPEPAPGAPPAATVSRAARLAEDWTAPDTFAAYAREHGYSGQQIDTELRKFLRYYSGPDGKPKKDYFSTWKNWLENVKPAAGTNGHANGHGHGSKDEMIDGILVSAGTAYYKSGIGDPRWIARARRWKKDRFWEADAGPAPGSPGCKCPPELLAPN